MTAYYNEFDPFAASRLRELTQNITPPTAADRPSTGSACCDARPPQPDSAAAGRGTHAFSSKRDPSPLTFSHRPASLSSPSPRGDSPTPAAPAGGGGGEC
jgi:hypothetical protein